MNFQRGRTREEPEMNLIPMIDVLLVILIFMMVTTTYARFSELQINLPQAGGEEAANRSSQIHVSVDATEHYAINNTPVTFSNAGKLAQELNRVAGAQKDPAIIISADAKAPHQAVINVLEAARLAGYGRITFSTSRK
ncbi:MAG: biopolymer transporter ExbD [Nitrosomonadales bacterium]|nr:biopolymer transporter ExbD [Nitrosomonadales bacterium]